jgi:transcriptional regulator with XRE-family HTH domain
MYAKYVQLRDAKGVTDKAVASATNIPPSTFTDWKQGRSKPKLAKLLKIAQFFGVSLDDLIKD